MRDIGISNDDIYEKYQEVMNESTKGYRRKVQLLDDRIDNLIDDIEKKIQKEDENPTYQRQLHQMLANMTKEHSEFMMAIKRVASTIDGGSKTIPQTQGHANPNHMQGYQEEPGTETPGGPGFGQPAAGQDGTGQGNTENVNEAAGDVTIKMIKNETPTQQSIRGMTAWIRDLYDMVGYKNRGGSLGTIDAVGKQIPVIKKMISKEIPTK